MQDCKLEILGSEWSIKFGGKDKYPNLADNDGYTDTSTKAIVVDDMSKHKSDVSEKENMQYYQRQVIRHEIIHAYLAESGLDGNGGYCDHWEFNEEMVDWFAIQLPKIFRTCNELNLL